MNLNVFLINSPFMQINSPYPSSLYLKSYIEEEFSLSQKNKLPFELKFIDFNIKLFNEIFSASGLKLIFDKAYEKFREKEHLFEDEKKEFFLFYYLNKSFYIENIDKIIFFLKGNKELNNIDNLSYFFSLLKKVPSGYRIKNYLEYKNYEYNYETIFEVFSLLIDELTDFINAFFDKNFKLSTYGYIFQTEFNNFSKVKEKLIEGDILNTFYKKIIKGNFDFEKLFKNKGNIFFITIPFPSCIVPAIYLAKFIKDELEDKSTIVFGGGYVSTELRFIRNLEVFKYVDFLVFDKGFLSLKEIILSFLRKPGNEIELEYENLYKTIIFDNNKITYINFDEKDKNYFQFLESIKSFTYENYNFLQFDRNEEYKNLEKNIIYKSFPDYSEIEFSDYIRLKESINPMYSLWSSEKWLKAFLAWGCWWSKCRFCDVNLNYIEDFIEVDAENLFKKLLEFKKKTGISGIHFVDEAMPLNNLIKFAFLNIKNGLPFSFWGNLRVDKRVNLDLIKFLSKAGLIAVTIGAETVLQSELDKIKKGISLEELIKTIYFFKSEGILVHLYLIYGTFGQSEEDIINMIEIVRQMFVEGIVDSVFFHRFVLTFFSDYIREFIEKKFVSIREKRERKNINKEKVNDSVRDNDKDNGIIKIQEDKIFFPEFDFAFNDLNFFSSSFYDKFDDGIQKISYNYNNYIGYEESISSFFHFPVVSPSVDEDYVQKVIESFDLELIIDERLMDKKVIFTGSNIFVNKIDNYNGELIWFYEGERKKLKLSLQFCSFFEEILNKINLSNSDYFSSGFENLISFSQFAKLFEERLKIPFISFANSKNFIKIKKNGLLFI